MLSSLLCADFLHFIVSRQIHTLIQTYSLITLGHPNSQNIIKNMDMLRYKWGLGEVQINHLLYTWFKKHFILVFEPYVAGWFGWPHCTQSWGERRGQDVCCQLIPDASILYLCTAYCVNRPYVWSQMYMGRVQITFSDTVISSVCTWSIHLQSLCENVDSKHVTLTLNFSKRQINAFMAYMNCGVWWASTDFQPTSWICEERGRCMDQKSMHHVTLW